MNSDVNKRFRACTLDQPFLLPPSLQEWVPEDHLARFVADITNELDLSGIYAEYERKDGRGLSAYHPLLLTRLLLYGYCTGITSSRRIERATYDDLGFRYLAANQHPDHDTIANFRRTHAAALAGLFEQVVRLCGKAGLVKLGNVAIDGTKLLANASPGQSMSHARLAEREEYWKKEVQRLMAEAERTDQQEDEQYGKGRRAEELPEELARAESRVARLRQARVELEQEAKERLQQLEQEANPRRRGRPRRDENGDKPTPEQQKANKKLRRARKQATEPTRQYNLVDPDSRVMRDGARKCFIQGYNAQVAVDSHAQVIVACELTQATTDRNQLIPMVEAVRANVGAPDGVLADAGYWNTGSLSDAVLEGIEVLVTPDSKPKPPGAPLPRSAPRNAEAMRMREVLSSESGRARYRLRQQVVEPVFGQIKEVRGIRRLRMRGLQRASQEWKFICATHDLLKLFRHRTLQGQEQRPARRRGIGRRARTQRYYSAQPKMRLACRPARRNWPSPSAD